jgi:transcriptional regulator with XRE-family HTH domain
MLNLLQELITEKMSEGKSFRDIEHETGVSHVSIGKYHKGSTPDGKNLAILAKYFNQDFYVLLASVKPALHKDDFGSAVEDRMAAEVWKMLSRQQKWIAVQQLHELQVSGEKLDQA